jgi:SAM-dependent methyltransferase
MIPKLFDSKYNLSWELKIFLFDKFFGYDFRPTSDLEEKSLLIKDGRHNNEPSGNSYLKRALKKLKITEHDSIVDIGCGKGDALRLFCQFEFNKITGIEYSQNLAKIANSNFSKKKFVKKNIEIVNIDAQVFEEYSSYNMFYLYNPFDDVILNNVLEKIINAKKESRYYIIYAHPVHHKLFQVKYSNLTFETFRCGISGDLKLNIYTIN